MVAHEIVSSNTIVLSPREEHIFGPAKSKLDLKENLYLYNLGQIQPALCSF
jgi:hypothetical protein